MSVLRLLLVTLPVLLFGVVVAFFSWIGRLNQRTRGLDAIARKFHGIAVTRSLCPHVQFPYFGASCTLGIQTNWISRHGRSTFVQLPWTNRKLKLEISSGGYAESLNRKSSALSKTGDAEFDREFPCYCNERDFVARSLDENFRWRFRELVKHAGLDSVCLRIDRGSLHLFRSQVLSLEQELDDFLRLSLQVIDQLRAAGIGGIQFVNQNKTTVVDDIVCPVCSEPVAGEMVVCVRCKTPHCRECWEYNTCCATFACGEKRFLSANASTGS